ncbi:MAG: prepilin-type N-terminal cleavage/methylation domain-containing protein [Candidatus Kerfeldbacteria bacterium]|nr:prepilin-type N-terminal cleavage/methylation domain-containing protein [Candidatus Kerfeldbacteria bacterium]
MSKGLTLLEILVVLGIIGVLITFGTLNLREYQRVSEVAQSAEDLSTVLREAQSRSMAVVDRLPHGVHIETSNSTYVLFSGATFNMGDPANRTYTLPTSVEFLDPSLADGGTSVLFLQLTGSTDTYGTVTLQSKTNSTMTRTITITNEGKIHIQ